MLIGVVSDAHSDVEGLRRALETLEATGVDEVISLGDVIEARDVASTPSSFNELVEWRPELAALLEHATLVRGNQEERILAAAPADIPLAALPLLEAPLQVDREGVVFRHGHDLEGETVEPDRWVPLHHGIAANVLVHGHHHRTSVIALGPQETSWRESVDVTPVSGGCVRLEAGRKYLVNIGPAWGDVPTTAVIDTEQNTVALVYAHLRPHPSVRRRTGASVAVLTSDRLAAVDHARDLANAVHVVAAQKYAVRHSNWLAVPDLTDVAAVSGVLAGASGGTGLRAVVAATEKAVLPAAIIRAELGVPGTMPETAVLFTDKDAMKARLRHDGIRVADWGRASSFEQVLEIAGQLGGDIVAKPVTGSGGRGVVACESVADLAAAKAAVDAILVDSDVIVEQRLRVLRELHCDAVVRNGVPVFATASVDHAPLMTVRRESSAGSILLDADLPLAISVRELHDGVVASLGLRDGVTHFECFETDEGLLAGEIACRPGGGGVVDVIRAATGVDLVEQQVRAELGLDSGLAERSEREVGSFGWSYVDAGEVSLDELRRVDGVYAVRPGDGGGQIHVVVFRADDHEATAAAHTRMTQLIGGAA